MRTLIFANRVTKEIIRDPLSLFFGLVFPLILLLLLSAINKSIPVDLFNIASLSPGIAVFGLSFMALFSAQVVSKDRASSFLTRLYTTPMTSNNFILGYMLPLLVMSCLQVIVCMVVAVILGFQLSWTIFTLIVVLIPVALIFIGLGLICGTLFSEKAATGLCGALLTNVAGWFSGIWFDLDLVGGLFKDIAYLLPFVHAVEMSKAALNSQPENLVTHLWWVLGYTVVIGFVAIYVFKVKTKES